MSLPLYVNACSIVRIFESPYAIMLSDMDDFLRFMIINDVPLGIFSSFLRDDRIG